ncbi:MAG TPA: DUF72 domain-containing protein [Polyangiaceae bacterium]|jgi:uncharacterized protein YecE (DUF72 family)
MKGTARIGISGWRYPPWRGVFYPKGLRQADELIYASRSVDSIEVNGSFYSLLHKTAVLRWREEVPPGFLFAVKGSRFITHMKRLGDVRVPLANFFASGVLAFEETLGPILWQLPPQLAFDESRIAAFLELLPKTTRDALKLARQHDERIAGRDYLQTAKNRPLRYAVEARHPSFAHPAFCRLLRAHDIAMCVADTAGVHPMFEDVTASFVYVRLHGATELYASGYSRRLLGKWAARIEPHLAEGRDVYVYFDNDARVRAPFDARALRAILRGEKCEPLPRGIRRAGESPRTAWPMGW